MAGAFTGVFNRAFAVAGLSFGVGNQSVASSLALPWDETVAAAKIGQLTTRTDFNTGTLTMNGGHGITTGRIDVYWSGGCRYGMTGTVTINSIAVDGGAGDDLPDNLTAVTAMNPVELEPYAVTGDDAVSVAASCPVGGTVVFADNADATIYAFAATTTNTTTVWIDGQGTNPLAGGTVAKVFLSHGNSGASSDLTGCVQFD